MDLLSETVLQAEDHQNGCAQQPQNDYRTYQIMLDIVVQYNAHVQWDWAEYGGSNIVGWTNEIMISIVIYNSYDKKYMDIYQIYRVQFR